MPYPRLLIAFLLGPLLVVAACFAARPCYTPEEASAHDGKDICVAAHVYDVVETEDGTRYLDVCKPGSEDGTCRFTVVSLSADRKEVGSLERIKAQDVQLRGVVHAMHGQSMMLLSHARQFHDGPEKFHPNASLMAGFGADREGAAFRDPSMSTRRQHHSSVFSGKADPVH